MPPVEPPHNAGYMVAAYIVAPVILLGYLLSLVRRVKRTMGGREGGEAERGTSRSG